MKDQNNEFGASGFAAIGEIESIRCLCEIAELENIKENEFLIRQKRAKSGVFRVFLQNLGKRRTSQFALVHARYRHSEFQQGLRSELAVGPLFLEVQIHITTGRRYS